jgi:hypothetical protein
MIHEECWSSSEFDAAFYFDLWQLNSIKMTKQLTRTMTRAPAIMEEDE